MLENGENGCPMVSMYLARLPSWSMAKPTTLAESPRLLTTVAANPMSPCLSNCADSCSALAGLKGKPSKPGQNQSEELNCSEVQNLSLGWIILGSKPNSVSKSIITFWQCNLGNCPTQFLFFFNNVDDLPNKFGEFPLPRKITWRCPQHQTTSCCLSQQDSFTNQPAGLQGDKSTESESPYIINMYLPLTTIWHHMTIYYIYMWLYEVIQRQDATFLVIIYNII